MDLIATLKKDKIIVGVEKIILTKEIKRNLLEETDQEFLDLAIKNSRKLDSFRIIYKSQGHNVVGYLVQPKKIKDKLPVLISNRGGSGEFSAINIGKVFNQLGRYANWGYVVFASQYSGNEGGEGRDEFGGDDVEDVLNLKKIIDIHPQADKNRIGMIGYSRGATMTYLSLARVSWIKVAVAVAGFSDLLYTEKYRPEMKEHFKKMFGGKKKDKIARSAIYWPEKFNKKTPILIMHGTADVRVNVLESINLAIKLYEHKINYKLIIYGGADHFLSEVKEESLIEIKKWFNNYLNK